MADPRILDALARLVDLMARLRAPGGCPWDREQTYQTLRRYVLEEAYEVVDAIDRGRTAELCEELGDLLLQVVFQADIAAEAGDFTLAEVANGIADKLVRRHPHVFADASVRDADEVMQNWRRIKAEERAAKGADTSVLAGVPTALPALLRAQEIGSKAAHTGFDWPDLPSVVAKLDEEQRELAAAVDARDRDAAARELGDVLLTATSVARHLGISAEDALREATMRFEARLRTVEAAARERGTALVDLGPAELDRLWQQAKRAV